MSTIATFYDHILDISRQERVSLTEALREARSLGVEQLEISQDKLIGREDEVGRELAYAGLGISAIPAYFHFGRDTDVEKQSLPTLEAAQFLGAKKLLVIPGFFDPEDGPEAREAQIENMINCINRLADLAAGYGASLVMEDYDNALAPFSTAAGVRRFLDGCPGLSCCFDTGNFRFSGEDAEQAYDLLRDRIGHVHLKDRAYSSKEGVTPLMAADGQALYPAPVGGGDLPIAELLSRLRRDGYDGPFTVEHYGAPAMLDCLKQSVQWVKEQLNLS